MAFDIKKGTQTDEFQTPAVNSNCDNNNTIVYSELQEFEDKFIPKRLSAEKLAGSFLRLEMLKRADRVLDCGTFLEFAHAIDSNGVIDEKGKLHNANFCRDRLCPMCSWRRSYKIFAQVSKIMEHCGNYKFVFLTLTVPNCSGDMLNKKLDQMFLAWRKLSMRKNFKRAVKGFFRALEITRSLIRKDYHPHFHCVLVVNKNYFTSRDYIKQEEWLKMWQECMQDDSITQVDVRKAKGKNGKEDAESLATAIAEIAKYAVKDADYIFDDDSLTDEVVLVLSGALHNRRLCAFDRNGVFGKIRKQLALDDAEDGDLIHLDDDKINGDLAVMIFRYGWSSGAYKMITHYNFESSVDRVKKTDVQALKQATKEIARFNSK